MEGLCIVNPLGSLKGVWAREKFLLPTALTATTAELQFVPVSEVLSLERDKHLDRRNGSIKDFRFHDLRLYTKTLQLRSRNEKKTWPESAKSLSFNGGPSQN